MARHEEGSTDTLESNIGHVCQPAAPQVTQLWYKKVGNRSFVGQTSVFICVSALSFLGCVCLPKTSSAAINTMYLEMKWISYEKSHSWKVVFLNIRECKAKPNEIGFEKYCNEIS